MDTSLLITLCIIFGVTLVLAIMRGMQRDRCLDDMDDYHVAIQWADGRVMWGELTLYSTGMELNYETDVLLNRSERKTSYIVYKDEYPKVQSVLRFVADLDDDHRKKRDRARDRAFHPSPFAYAARQLRNYVNTAANSLSEALGLVLGQSRLATSGYVLASGQTHLQGLTKDVLSYVGTSYDEMIESMVGAQVIAEVTEENEGETEVFEYDGVLREYSTSFLHLMDVEFTQLVRLELDISTKQGGPQPQMSWCGLDVRCDDKDNLVFLTNNTELKIVLASATIDGKTWKGAPVANQRVARGVELRMVWPARSGILRLDIKTIRLVDMILPRSVTRIRHRAEDFQAADALDIDLPIAFQRDDASGTDQAEAIVDDTIEITPADLRISRAFAKRHDLALAEDGTAVARSASDNQEKSRLPRA